jgi:PIN domain nuclease of toxin-antitoxin system
MNALLDTHVFLWAELESHKVSQKAMHTLNQAEKLYVSIASIWEMQIKYSLNKLPLIASVADIVDRGCQHNTIYILPITSDHIYRLADLPQIHKDPFDRMLIAQAQHENLTLVTSDGNIPKYAVRTAW